MCDPEELGRATGFEETSPALAREDTMRAAFVSRLLSALLLLPAVLLATACAPPKGVTIDWSIGPIQFELNSDGTVGLTGQKQWVTPMGTFSVGQDPDAAGKDKLALVIRHLKAAAPVDDVFTVPTTADVLVDVDGHTQVGIRGRTVTVDATQAQIREITLTGVAWQMPDLRGRSFDDAKSELTRVTDGVVSSRSAYDASGRGRYVMFTRDWRVCTQSVPVGGQITADTAVGFGIVKNGEPCPDGSPVSSPIWPMPSFAGAPLDEANGELNRLSGGTIAAANTHDATGAGRSPYFTERWRVCSQTPPPTSTIAPGTPIEFGVVGDDESCPATSY